MIQTVRVSQQAKEQLIALKRRTGIAHNNVLCRWALCRSLSEQTPPARTEIITDSNIEIDWRTFGGAHAEIYSALLRQRAREDSLETDDETIGELLRLHLHRGIGYLYGDRTVKDIESFIEVAGLEAG